MLISAICHPPAAFYCLLTAIVPVAVLALVNFTVKLILICVAVMVPVQSQRAMLGLGTFVPLPVMFPAPSTVRTTFPNVFETVVSEKALGV